VTAPLAEIIKPCGPVIDPAAAARARESLEGGGAVLERAWPALAPVFSASPYLAGLARRAPERLARILAADPTKSLDRLLAAAGQAALREDGAAELRRLKAELHLLTALADLGGAWDLDQVTSALARFADAAVASALALAAREAMERGRLLASSDPDTDTDTDTGAGPVPGLFVIAMGKHGGMELNYSSDIDVSVFYEPGALPLAPGVEHQTAAAQLTQSFARILQERTADGYVFRVDLRLRPDPAATPVAVPIDAALEYYESVGQNWERAAFIKARPCAGELARAGQFLEALRPFVWRRNLDFAAIADIHSIKRQIHVHKADERLTAPGANLKLGAGGIREIEFYVQTQQLILGGRDPSLRSGRTLDALSALAAAGHVDPDAAQILSIAYCDLRAWEHRIQMVGDEQTHRLPQAPADRRRVAALSGFHRLASFDAAVSRTLKAVNRRYGELFAGEEPLASRFGSLVFTGVEDDPATLATLARMGFSNPAQVAATIRAWHHGRINATRTERGRELFTRLAPRLLEAVQASGAPDAAFARFIDFFAGMSSGVQVQSLFLAQPQLLELVVRVLAFAPELARTLARRPAALEALFDPEFLDPIAPDELASVIQAARQADGFEAAMDAVRRIHRDQGFRIGVQVMSGAASADEAGRAFAELADACIRALAPAALAEVERIAGAFPGEVAVVALGKCGSREMTARSDLDLMTLYRPGAPEATSSIKGWSAETFYARFTQRLVAALSAPTGEGGLYEVDLQLRPSGTAGPVAVSVKAFEGYYQRAAETWELMALTRARVVWSTSDAFTAEADAAVGAALRRPREAEATARDVLEMRQLMERERPPSGFWDLKLSPGGLVDIEFAAQHLQILHAAEDGPVVPNTAAALAALAERGLLAPGPALALQAAWRPQQDLSQLLKLALSDSADPASEPAGFRKLLARAGGARGFPALERRLAKARAAARQAFVAVLNLDRHEQALDERRRATSET
jgi:glutamate-ammonia-ligase adenylyltransferase